ncbi:MAG TPA: CBS domain-containing protein [Ruminococcaceae bacterium]|nr:CBS domain-containing protein [Oscillospiraceae bacterium]
MKVQDIMSKELAGSNAGDTVQHAAELMRQYDVGSVPVCSDGKLVGVVTDRDIAIRSAAGGQDPRRQKVADIMSRVPVVGSSEMDVQNAARMMSENQIRRLYIVDGGRLSGVLALGDISTAHTCESNAGETLKNISKPSRGAQA